VLLCTDANGGATTSGCATVSGIVAIANGGTGASTGSAALTNLGAVAATTTVNGHALSGNVTVSASDLTTGTLAHAQLPVLVSADIPNNAANTTGSASGFTGSLAGDVTGTQSSTSVGKINGGIVPVSANVLSSNASSQLIATTSHNLSMPANCIAASGSGTTYTCSTSPAFTPAVGDHIQFKADVANTGSATLSVNGGTASIVKKWGGSGNLIANDLLAGHWVSATFDGSYWQLEGQLGNANATELNGTTITGLSGSGSVVALTNSPVFTTPALGVASATSVTASSFVGPLMGNASTATTAASLSGASTLPNGTTATTQSAHNNSTNLATTAYVDNAVSVPSAAPFSDILCASGNSGWPNSQNVSIGSLSISNITYSGGTFTFTTASGLQNDGYLVGQTVQATGTTGGTGNFNAQYIIAGISSQTSFTATSGTATGTAYGSGGTVSMVCNNNSDVISFGTMAAFASTLSLPPMTSFTQYGIRSQYELITPTTAPTLNLPVLYYNGVSVASVAGSLSLGTSKYSVGSVKYTFTVPQTGNIVATIDSQSLSTSAILTVGGPPSYTATSASYPLSLRTYFSTAGVSFADTITYSSGGTSCTNGTQTVTFTNGGGAGATGTITVSGGIPSGAVTVTTPGYGYTSVPTTGTVATCSGATTFTSSGSLGGGAGTALRLLSFTAHN
jgi:hypothetical protein